MITKKYFFAALLLVGSCLPLAAAVRLPNVIGEHMVLQRNMPDAIWGWADPGEQVTVSFRNQQKSDTPGSDGKWQITLDPMQAGGPFEMRITGTNVITLADVMVGEVWVGSGQSNMWWPVRLAGNAQQEIGQANYPKMRLFTVDQNVSAKPLDNVEGTWSVTSPSSIPDFSALAYYFGRELYRHFDVPVGLITASWGATTAEGWTSRAALESDPALQPILWNWKRVIAEYPYAWNRYQEQLRNFQEESAQAKSEGKPAPHRPFPPLGSGQFGTFEALPDAQNQWTPGGLFNAMISPLTRFSIRGVIWYQGENNAVPYGALQYGRLFQTLITDWRRSWDEGPFPFLFVQLANFRDQKILNMAPQPNPSESAWAELRASQVDALALPNTGMVVTIDIGEADNIHPKNKQEVGRRLFLLARSIAYDEPVMAFNPIYRGLIVEQDRIRVRFDHVGGGLIAKGESLQGFEIAGRDRKFVAADARVEGDAVVVWSKQVPHPIAVRYAWADNPEATLFNKEGLPASPFRTDDWSELSQSVGAQDK